jgi:serine/threonine protein kinase
MADTRTFFYSLEGKHISKMWRRRYYLHALLDEGKGDGAVYLAYQIKGFTKIKYDYNRPKAIKILVVPSMDKENNIEETQERVREEFNTAKIFSNFGNAIAIEAWGKARIEQRTCYYLVMPYLEGRSLDFRLRHLVHVHITLSDVRHLVNCISPPLIKAHNQNIPHGDLKPTNIVMDGSGNPHLADFGLSRRLGVFIGANQTSFALPYIAPEELKRSENVIRGTTQGDQYALAAIIHQMITREVVYPELLRKKTRIDGLQFYSNLRLQYPDEGGLPPNNRTTLLNHLKTHDPDRAQKISDVLGRALSLNSVNRYETLSKFTEELSNAIGERNEEEHSEFFKNHHPEIKRDIQLLQPSPFNGDRRFPLIAFAAGAIAATMITVIIVILLGITRILNIELPPTQVTILGVTVTSTPTEPIAYPNETIAVYENPFDNDSVIATVRPNEEIPLLAVSNDRQWYRVRITGQLGWITASSHAITIGGSVNNLDVITIPTLIPSPTITNTPSITPTPTPSIPIAVVQSDIELYLNPLAKDRIIGTLERGKTVELLARSPDGDYFLAQAEDQTAWISASQLLINTYGSLSDLPVTPLPTLSPTPTSSFTPTWTQTNIPTATPTYTLTNTALPSTATPTATPTSATPVAHILLENIDVYAAPNTNSVTDSLGQGDNVTILGSYEGWYLVQLEDMERGWILAHSSQVSVDGPLTIITVVPTEFSTPDPETQIPVDEAIESLLNLNNNYIDFPCGEFDRIITGLDRWFNADAAETEAQQDAAELILYDDYIRSIHNSCGNADLQTIDESSWFSMLQAVYNAQRRLAQQSTS